MDTTRRLKVLLEWDGDAGVWVTTVPALGGLSTFGESRDDALAHTREAILGYLEALQIEGLTAPVEDDRTELVEITIAV